MATGGIAGSAVKGIGRIFFGGGGEGLKLKKGTRLRIELRKELKLKLKEGQVSTGKHPQNGRTPLSRRQQWA
jgi:hypothetical protein